MGGGGFHRQEVPRAQRSAGIPADKGGSAAELQALFPLPPPSRSGRERKEIVLVVSGLALLGHGKRGFFRAGLGCWLLAGKPQGLPLVFGPLGKVLVCFPHL